MSDYLYPVELVDTSILSPVFQKIPGISLLRPPTFPNPQESTLPFDETLELRPSARAWARPLNCSYLYLVHLIEIVVRSRQRRF